MDKLIMAIATGFGLGYLPKAPGTWGTLLALPIHFLIYRLPPNLYFSALGVILVLAILTAGSAEKILDQGDPGLVVIDEVIGMLVALIYAPPVPWVWLLAFVLFRFFDILKPFPIGLIDQRFHGGLGIVMDDLMAGLYSLILVQLACYFFIS